MEQQTPGGSLDPDDLVGLADLAELLWAADLAVLPAEEDRQRVLNQKQAILRMARHRDERFPEPRALWGRTSLYRLGDLLAWWEDRQEPVGVRGAGPAAPPPRWALWRAVDACQRDHGLERTRRYVTGLVLVCSRDPQPRRRAARSSPSALGRGAEVLSRLTALLERGHPDLAGLAGPLLATVPPASASGDRLVGAVSRVLASGEDPPSLLDEALDRLAPTPIPRRTTTTPVDLTGLVVEVADPRPGQTVVDPAAGEGGFLLAASEHAGGRLDLHGRELDEWAWRTARVRCFLQDVQVDLGPGPSDSLADPELRALADVVVLDPPLAQRQLRRWLGQVPAMLSRGGRAVVVVPEAALAPLGTWRPAVDPALVQAVVSGAGRLRGDVGDPLAVVVLGAVPATPPVLLVDVSQLSQRRGARQTLAPADLRGVREILRAWRAGTALPDAEGVLAGTVPRDELGGDLRPSTRLGQHRRTPDPRAVERALTLANTLLPLVEGPLRDITSEEHRRALSRLIKRLGSL